MNALSVHFYRLMHRLLLCLLLAGFLGSSGQLSAALSAQKPLKMKLSADRLTAEVTVPEGIGSVTVQQFQLQSGWQKVVSQSAVVGTMKFSLPASGRRTQWRAIGWYEVESASRTKFPPRFYRGKNKFPPVVSISQSWVVSPGLIPSAIADAMGTGVQATPVEADIWKVDGNTVYFFNQLRGLQVLDLTNPKDPRLTASLRLPAVGQDLYVLPSATAERTLVLLTEGWSREGGQWTRINLVKVSGTSATITYSQEVPGSLADSRLAGNRLILATTDSNRTGGLSIYDVSVRSRLSEWVLTPDTPPVLSGETWIEGATPVIAAGADWLAVAVSQAGRGDVSFVSVFAIRPSGLVRMAPPFRTAGVVSNKFRMQWSDNVLTTISERRWNGAGWAPTTVLETFRAWAPEVIHPMVVEPSPLGRLELAKGESLYATRFAGNKAYVVTFLRTDPLWVVDLTDPLNPAVSGHLEVPGWSSHLEPMGDLLFSIGWESGTVAASLFDVADPAKPLLLRRLNLGPPGTFSEALWDEQALKVLPDAGLAMIPVSAYDGEAGQWKPRLQLVDVDLQARDLRLRGQIPHAFDARRSDLIGQSVISISQRVLVSADLADRDHPEVSAEVSLAWPVDRVMESGDYLLQIEDARWFGGGVPCVRVSPAHASEQILAEHDLGGGSLKAADCRNGKLYVLRETGTPQPIYYWGPVRGGSSGNPLVLDIYDLSALPAMTLLGSCAMTPPPGAQLATDRFLWPHADRPAIVLDFRFNYWFAYDFPGIIRPLNSVSESLSLTVVQPIPVMDPRPFWVPEQAPVMVLFDTMVPEAPVAAAPVSLGPVGTMLNGVNEAANGRIVLGTSCWKNPQTGQWLNSGSAVPSMLVIKVGASGPPSVHPLIDLPGDLFAATDLDARGFLAFTKSSLNASSTSLHVSACDGFDAFLITSLEAAPNAVTSAGGRRLFVAKADGVEPYLLNDQGVLISEAPIKIGWTPDALRCLGNTLIGASGHSLCAASADGTSATSWSFPTWNLGLDRINLATDGDLLVPFGDYGTERLKP